MEQLLIKRFQIDDMLSQDASGVVFRANDTQSGNIVELRRFFPFGAHGGGLNPEEQTAYDSAVKRLAEIRHPALRTVLCGGCDPVDGMPYIVTECVEGTPIGPLLGGQALPAPVATELLSLALEVCELLSHVFAKEAVWVDTAPDSIILGNEASGRGFTYWISPIKWLAADKQPRGLGPLVALTEALLGWQGQIVADRAAGGLGSWLNWLRQAAPGTSFKEARENLAAALNNEPHANVRQLLDEARAQPPPPLPRPSSKPLAIGVVGLAMMLAGLGGWTWHHGRQVRKPEATGNLMRETRNPPSNGHKPTARQASQNAALLAAEAAEAWQGGVFQHNQGDLLARHEGTVASLEGVLRSIEASKSGKTLYLMFSDNPGRNDPRGAVTLRHAKHGIDRESLKALVGKKVRITGTVRVTRNSGLLRPEIPITKRAAIQIMD